jgi:DNA invertase Pin-like site-specific DNA recombinase
MTAAANTRRHPLEDTDGLIPGVGYCRLSTKTETNRINIPEQRRTITALAKAHGVRITHWVIEDGVRAFDADGTGVERPGYTEVLGLMDSRTVGAVLAFQQDRLLRDNGEVAGFLKLARRVGLWRLITGTSTVDPASPGDELLAVVLGGIGRMESAVKQARALAKARALALAGEPGTYGGARPFGFGCFTAADGTPVGDDRVTPNPDESAWVVSGVDAVLEGVPLREIARRMNAAGVLTTAGKPWTVTALRHMLTSPRVAGYRTHVGSGKRDKHATLLNAVWPALVDVGKWELACAVLNDPSRRTNTRQRRYLLTGGIARCGVEGCGRPLVSRPRNGQPRYICSKDAGGCGGISIMAGPFETEVANQVRALCAELVLPAVESPAAEDGGTVAALTARLMRLEDMLADELLDEDGYKRQRARVTDQLRDARARLAERAMPTWVIEPGRVAAEWDDLTHDDRRAAVLAVATSVTVLPATRRGPGPVDVEQRVRVEWTDAVRRTTHATAA